MLASRTAANDALHLAAAQAAAAWRDCGVLAGETVAIRLGECVEARVATLGAALAGAVPVEIGPLVPAHEWQRLWSQARWRFILADSRAELPAAMRDFVLTRAEWQQALHDIPPVAP